MRFRSIIGALLLLCVAGGARAQIVCGGAPFSFVNGTVADATQVNANFAALVACINSGNGVAVPQTATYASLKALTGGVYPAVFRRAYAAEGDGGNAYYYWSQAATCVDDVGGCVAPNVGGGRWLLIPQYPLNPNIWGVVANPQFYVSKAGSDASNYCLVQSAPCLTVNHAFQTCNAFLLTNGGNSQRVNVAAGTYAESVYADVAMLSQVGTNGISAGGCLVNATGAVVVTGDGINPCTICVTGPNTPIGLMGNPGTLTLNGLRVAGQADLYVQECGFANVYQGVVFGSAGTDIIMEDDCSQIQVWNDTTFSGNANCAWAWGDGGSLKFNGNMVVTFSGTPVYAAATACGVGNSILKINGGTTFVGAVTGAQFTLIGGGRIYSQQTPGANVALPGTASSSVLSGGAFAYPEGTVTGATPTATGCTGLGASGTCAVNYGDSHSGVIGLSPVGAGPGSSGTGTLTLPVKPLIGGANGPQCQLTPEGFAPGATATIGSVSGNAVTFQWTSPAPLVAGSAYFIAYACPS